MAKMKTKEESLREAIEILNNIPRWCPEVGIPLSEPRISDENLGRLKELLTHIDEQLKEEAKQRMKALAKHWDNEAKKKITGQFCFFEDKVIFCNGTDPPIIMKKSEVPRIKREIAKYITSYKKRLMPCGRK